MPDWVLWALIYLAMSAKFGWWATRRGAPWYAYVLIGICWPVLFPMGLWGAWVEGDDA